MLATSGKVIGKMGFVILQNFLYVSDQRYPARFTQMAMFFQQYRQMNIDAVLKDTQDFWTKFDTWIICCPGSFI